MGRRVGLRRTTKGSSSSSVTLLLHMLMLQGRISFLAWNFFLEVVFFFLKLLFLVVLTTRSTVIVG